MPKVNGLWESFCGIGLVGEIWKCVIRFQFWTLIIQDLDIERETTSQVFAKARYSLYVLIRRRRKPSRIDLPRGFGARLAQA
jgi:hypothetical protein